MSVNRTLLQLARMHLPRLLGNDLVSKYSCESKFDEPDLEEDLRTHAEETIHDPECKDHRHAVDIPVTKTCQNECKSRRHQECTNKLKNQGNDATDS